MKTRILGAAALLSCVALASACGHSAGADGRGEEPALAGNSQTGTSAISATKFSRMSAGELAELAVTGGDAERTVACNRLRELGPGGLAAIEAHWAPDIECLRSVGSFNPDEALEMVLAFTGSAEPFEWEPGTLSQAALGDPAGHQSRLEQAFARVSGQHDGLYSGLFWHTDRDEALAAARAAGRPLLSLRVLGRLDDAMC